MVVFQCQLFINNKHFMSYALKYTNNIIFFKFVRRLVV